MKDSEAIAFLKDITYKPNWRFEIYQRWDKWGDIQILIKFDTIDPVTKEPIPIAARHMLSRTEVEYMQIFQLQLYMWNLIMEAERHEAKEWFRNQGKQIYSAHDIH